MGNFRTERDTLGEVQVPSDKFWGAQTQRSLNNFDIGTEKMPIDVVYALTLIKKAAAIVNHQLGKLAESRMKAIVTACDLILAENITSIFHLQSGKQEAAPKLI
jgi:fumarate hydratase class II